MAQYEINNCMDIDAPSIATINSPAVQAQLSDISTLPDDVLLYLFYMTIHAPDADPFSPMTFSHVSARWRELALYAPMLWTTITVAEELSATMLNFERTLYRVPHFLERSKDLPLSLHITLHSYHEESAMHHPDHPFAYNVQTFRHHTRRLSDFLGRHVARFKSFILVGDEFESVQDIQSSFPHIPMPLLESYRVWQRDDYQCLEGDLRDPSHIGALSIPLRPRRMTVEESTLMYPKLVDMTLKGIPLEWFHFSPRNLQYLHIGFLPIGARPTGEDFRHILLANEHSLEALKIQGACPVNASVEPYVLSNLKSFELAFAYPEEAIPLIQSMQTPNLISLSFTDLRRKFVDVGQRPSVEYDWTTLMLFEEVGKHMPLQSILQCSLSHVCFLPPLINLHMYPPIKLASNPGFRDYPIPKTLLRFFRKMTALQLLLVVDPDPCTLRCLNFTKSPAPEGGETDQNPFAGPVPLLSHLHLSDFHLPIVQNFILNRFGNRASARHLENLMLSMPATWADRFGPCLTPLADNVEVYGTIMDSDIEAALTLPLHH
ncbi:hypothetical protein BDZ94DRAFT_484261 [Collybia nuda]|uniref:F-box domain-containing protein n=1 Tax=Collybia nuda TaxID=64659 RepID=A0A9P5XQZ3_9AGAR|nr:hypothetical protein BDZ94DRAFT_484261 [Collybia nuda]